MIGFPEVVSAAALLNNSVSAIDKVYNWWSKKEGGSPADIGLRSDDARNVLQYVDLTGQGREPRVVITYEELARRLTKDDLRFVEACDARMRSAMRQWEDLNAGLPLASPVERTQIEANMERLKDRDICFSLKQIVDFIDNHGIDLCDHYRSVRSICPSR